MWRSWRLTAVGAAAPLFGDVLTAAFVAPVNSGIDPVVTVADTTKYQQGDRITLDPAGTTPDTVLVMAILSSTTMQVSSQGAPLHNHANGTVICLAIAAAEVVVQAPQANTASAWLGTDNTVTAAGAGNAIYELVKSLPPFREAYDAGWNKVRTDELWIAGTSGDHYLASAEVI